jgi:CheY-like chemotaxis protein
LQLMSKATDLLGFQAITSASPRCGLALAAEENPSLIMVDMLMDEMDGPEFVRLVRRSPDIAHVPVLIYSAGTGCIDEETARKAGADGFLQKPLGLGDLSQAIHAFAMQG